MNNSTNKGRSEPNPNWTISVRFEPVTVLSFEKSSYILKKELSFLPDWSSVILTSFQLMTRLEETRALDRVYKMTFQNSELP
jgi:hypothetical protein